MKTRTFSTLIMAALGIAAVLNADAAGTTSASLEAVATFNGPMPTGVAVSKSGRVFVCFPRWGDPVPYTVAEVTNGQAIHYPSAEFNMLDAAHADRTLVSVQSVVMDAADRLWLLDSGSIKMAPVLKGGPKLVAVDLATNRVVRTIDFPTNVVFSTTYLNDVRFDLRQGTAGVAYITDSSGTGPNGIIVVDLGTGRSRRLLNDDPSTKAEPGFTPVVDGEALMQRKPGEAPKPFRIGSDGIAISPDGSRLYYSPLSARHLYSIPTAALLDTNLAPAQVSAQVKDEGPKVASDGLESDAQGRIYATDFEHRAIMRRGTDGKYETLVKDDRLFWPDTLCLAQNGYLYLTVNQLERQPDYHDGKDLREKPYYLFRLKVDARPVLLRAGQQSEK